jgi:inner membrane protein
MALGASVGYAVAGKEMGPKALLWGAVGGTLPDLDVFGNAFLDDLEGLAFHRGFTHSIIFMLLGPIIMTPLFRWYYRHKLNEKKWVSIVKWILVSFALLLGLAYIGISSFVLLGTVGMGISFAVTLVLYGLLWPKRNELLHSNPNQFKGADTSFGKLYLFFFAVFVTHIFIDVCTTYGTQIFYPFDLYRASIHNISVIDPLYTLPLLLGIIGSLYAGAKANGAGLLLSSLYMGLTFFNLMAVKDSFTTELEKEGIAYERYMVSPTLMNNVIWNGIAESDSFYYLTSMHVGGERLYDFTKVKKDRKGVTDEVMKEGGDVLAWFSNGYYETRKTKKGVTFKDLRFAMHYKDTVQTGMGFTLQKKENGEYETQEVRDRNMNLGEFIPYFRNLLWGNLPDS